MRFHKLEEFLRTVEGRAVMGSHLGGADFAQLIHDAQKFYIGAVALWDPVPMPITIPRLPYALCVFEFEDEDPKGKTVSGFMLAEELSEEIPGADALRVHVFIPLGKEFLHNGWLDIERRTQTYNSYVNRITLSLLKEDRVNAKTVEESTQTATSWLFKFLSVLNCSNVRSEIVLPEPALNKKRSRNGRVPIYSYKVLILKSKERRLAVGRGGTHESPRIHLRRGHIKNRATGSFWWQPCVVGSKERGIVVKDYRADALAQ